MKTKILILAILLTLTLSGAALANGSVERPRWVLGGGASEATTGNVSLRASLGQTIVGAISGGDIVVGQGFWYGNLHDYKIYLPMVMRIP